MVDNNYEEGRWKNLVHTANNSRDRSPVWGRGDAGEKNEFPFLYEDAEAG